MARIGEDERGESERPNITSARTGVSVVLAVLVVYSSWYRKWGWKVKSTVA